MSDFVTSDTEARSSCSFDNAPNNDVDDLVLDEDNIRILEEYRALVKLYRQLPKDMCVNEIARVYAYSESDLERLRADYFIHLKQTCRDFPFSESAELKRRVFTRSGDPLALRLAQDIYSIVEVTEGGDPSTLKTMISAGKTRKVSVAQGDQGRVFEKRVVTCSCSSEIPLLRDQVSTLQADVLLLKQMVHANDIINKEQSINAKRSLNEIKGHIAECSYDININCKQAISNVRSVVNSAMDAVLQLEDRIRLLEVFIDSRNLVSITKLDTLKTTIIENDRKFCESNPTHFSEEVVDDNSTLETVFEPIESVVEENMQPIVSSPEERCVYNENRKVLSNSLFKQINNTRFDRSSQNDTVNCESKPIPVRITTRVDDNMHESKSSDFQIYRRKRTKRFCLLGLSKQVDIDILAKVVAKKGPIVPNIRVFPSRNDPHKVVIRLNVYDDDKADRVLSDNFWPGYVTCHPWRSRAAMSKELPRRMQNVSKIYWPNSMNKSH